MKLLKTKSIQLVFYSIIRQLESSDILSFNCLNSNEKTDVIISDIKSDRTAMIIMLQFAKIRDLVEKGKVVVITLFNAIAIQIYRDSTDGYYVVDNAVIILNYIIYNSVFDSNKFRVKILDENDKILDVTSVSLKNKFNGDSLFYESKLEKNLSNIEKISNRILEKTEGKNISNIIIEKEKEKSEFFIVEA